MRIALLTDGLWPLSIGGMQKHSSHFARALAGAGHSVTVWHPAAAGSRPVLGGMQGITEIALPPPPKGKLPGHYLREEFKWSEIVFDSFRKESGNFDLVYAQGFTAWRLLREKKRGGKFPPVAVNFHGLEMFQQAGSLRAKLIQYLLRPAVRENLLAADICIALGSGLAKILEAQGVPEENICILPIGIDPNWRIERPRSSGAERRFVFIGRNEFRKGLHVLEPVLARLHTSHAIRFDMIGPDAAAHARVPHFVHYHGLVRNENEIRAMLQAADVLVLPSISEGLPTVLLEAMSSGLALIGTSVGAVPDLINDNGFLVQVAEPEELQNAIQLCADMDASGLDEMKLKSLSKVKEFAWPRILQLTEERLFSRLKSS